jgi:drug/metabolite transporter (DMT)-like permease
MAPALINILLLSASIALTVGRSIFSKSVSGNPFGTRRFFFVQSLTFGVAALLMLILSFNTLSTVSPLSWLLALLYGICLVSSQWCYTAALRKGNTSICATVYSFGFFIPALSGMLFFHEEMTVCKVAGLLLLIPALLCSVRGGTRGEGKYVLPLLIAMVSSGGLGLLQKVQQHSPVAGETGMFLLLAFLFAALASLAAAFMPQAQKSTPLPPRHMAAAAAIGICFGAANLFNTTLSGRMESSVFFPVQNVSVIVLCTLLGMLLYHERLRHRDIGTFLFGIGAILLLNL